MENVVLIVHLLLALSLIGIVLLQRSEGGGLGMGGGGGAVSARSAATAMNKLTWVLAICFIITSMTLTIIAARNSTDSSVLDQLGIEGGGSVSQPAGGLSGDGESLLPPSGDADPLAPPPVD